MADDEKPKTSLSYPHRNPKVVVDRLTLERVEDEKRIARLESQLKAAVRALKWYADEKNYASDRMHSSVLLTQVEGDDGEKARRALRRIEEDDDAGR